MPLLACTVCGRASDQRRCPAHRRSRNAHWSPNRDRTKQAAFRRAVLTRDNFTCACGHHDPTGRTLRAAHTIPLRDFPPGDLAAYDPANGATRCEGCDRDTDQYAR